MKHFPSSHPLSFHMSSIGLFCLTHGWNLRLILQFSSQGKCRIREIRGDFYTNTGERRQWHVLRRLWGWGEMIILLGIFWMHWHQNFLMDCMWDMPRKLNQIWCQGLFGLSNWKDIIHGFSQSASRFIRGKETAAFLTSITLLEGEGQKGMGKCTTL